MENYFTTGQGEAVHPASAARNVSLPLNERVYTNQGNSALIDLLMDGFERALDIGCGAGDNAALIKSRGLSGDLYGITCSVAEAASAKAYMKECWIVDIEADLPDDLQRQSFDVLIFSHILEHLRNPATVLMRLSRLLTKGGQVLIAVPNILFYRTRFQFLKGDFRYSPEGGALDDTHLHFYTYFTADQYLLSEVPDLKLTHKVVSGIVPQGPLRRYVPAGGKHIDSWGLRRWPNLFGSQVLIRAVKQ
jgi:2-polyprenyl-3-methyl-5-hydroxy-6-metoxy-1,4-benzoquinol methylase